MIGSLTVCALLCVISRAVGQTQPLNYTGPFFPAPGVQPSVPATSMTCCNNSCSLTPGCSGVIYNTSTSQCSLVMCNNRTLTPTPLVAGCSFPAPLFDFMMTYPCGTTPSTYDLANTGTLYPGVPMKQFNSANKLSWTPTSYLPAPGSNNTYAYIYPGQTGPISWAVFNGSYTINMQEGITMFGYYWMNQNTGSYYFIVLGNTDGNGNWNNAGNTLEVEYLSGGMEVWTNNIGCTGDCVGWIPPTYTPILDQWTAFTVVYDPSISKWIKYLNGNLLATDTATTTFSGTTTGPFNAIANGGKNNYGAPAGASFCLKVFNFALTQQEIQMVMQSCMTAASIQYT